MFAHNINMGHAATKPDKVNIWLWELKIASVAENLARIKNGWFF